MTRSPVLQHAHLLRSDSPKAQALHPAVVSSLSARTASGALGAGPQRRGCSSTLALAQ